jgi:hypothetical protein
MGPTRVVLTPEQRALIDAKIAGYVAGSSSEDARRASASARALPLCLDWSACLAIRPDGELIWIDYDEPHRVRPVASEHERYLALFQGGRSDPDLQFLIPARPAGAVDCPDCKGTGRLTFPPGREDLADRCICTCGGNGWKPA